MPSVEPYPELIHCTSHLQNIFLLTPILLLSFSLCQNIPNFLFPYHSLTKIVCVCFVLPWILHILHMFILIDFITLTNLVKIVELLFEWFSPFLYDFISLQSKYSPQYCNCLFLPSPLVGAHIVQQSVLLSSENGCCFQVLLYTHIHY
jgi:hypothetical protein